MNTICTDIAADQELESVGKILKEARRKNKVRDLNAIARELCITPYLLEALEQGNFSSFPSACYATGFLKNYASFLGLDTKDIISRYEAEYAGSKECVVLSFPEAEHKDGFPFKKIAGVVSVCVAIFVGAWATANNLDTEEAILDITENSETVKNNVQSSAMVEATTVKQVAKTEGIEEAQVISAEDKKLVTSNSVLAGEIKFQANDDVWIKISSEDGSTVVEKLMTKGENLTASEESGLTLMTNNAAALSVTIGDDHLSAMGAKGEILENISLEQEKLREISLLH